MSPKIPLSVKKIIDDYRNDSNWQYFPYGEKNENTGKYNQQNNEPISDNLGTVLQFILITVIPTMLYPEAKMDNLYSMCMGLTTFEKQMGLFADFQFISFKYTSSDV